MEYILNAKEMKYCDTNTIDYFQIPSMVLMERAALCIATEIFARFDKKNKILIVCGSGNNGGDGFAVARLLHLQGYSVTIYCAGNMEKCTPETKNQYETALKYQIPCIGQHPSTALDEFADWNEIQQSNYDVIVDAIFGVGLARNIEGRYAALIERLNEYPAYKIAVDIPSGISADTGNIMGIALTCDLTVTIAYCKAGLLLYPGADHAGEIIRADIGITDESWLDKKPALYRMEPTDLSMLSQPINRANKGSQGKVLVIAGRKDMSGAAYLCASAAYHTGCGLVRVFTPEENRVILQTQLPEAILTTYSDKKLDVAELNEAIDWADVIVFGCGIGTDTVAEQLVKTVLKNTSVPTILDADALNVIAKDPEMLRRPHPELVLTPHLGEMARLTNDSVSYIQNNIVTVAQEFAREYNVICMLKDATSVCAIPYGKTYLNTSGCAGMATAGAGDVLSGVIAGCCAQGMSLELAAPFGAYLHGMAGTFAGNEKGMHALMASDIIEQIGNVLKQELLS